MLERISCGRENKKVVGLLDPEGRVKQEKERMGKRGNVRVTRVGGGPAEGLHDLQVNGCRRKKSFYKRRKKNSKAVKTTLLKHPAKRGVFSKVQSTKGIVIGRIEGKDKNRHSQTRLTSMD